MSGETSLYPEPAHSRSAGGWTGRDLVIGTSLIVLLVTLFMPWFSRTVLTTSNGASRAIESADGPSAHGYIWFVFALVIIALIVLVARDALSRIPGNLPSPAQILIVATGLALLLTIFGAFIKPSPSVALVSQLSAITVSVGFSYGGFLALVAALVAFLAAIGAGGQLNTARLGRPAMRRRTSTSAPG